MSLRLLINRKRFRNRDMIELSRLQNADAPDYGDMCKLLARFMVDDNDQTLPADEAYEALLDLTVDETMEAIQRLSDAVTEQKDTAVPPTTAEP